ncbi:GHKL domain-containing protein [Anaerocolumna chitinilytica]|uniref:Sensor histidine kinase NatK-like C-terminal domain-containing protein n=1 Tax=Anaerocolumna chitinilytica TaxID=1727145 RepID=A0A7I8DGV8_9FIRM|nr:GHKL domain-containing protein [Anaerocolumna chitinilytica]BCJ97592.1 hypothetical protein bsdcttw_06330 [Anaerocolumna chitinilytica]
MEESLQYFYNKFFDAAWVIQLVVLALSWVFLCNGGVWKKEIRFRVCLEFLILLAVLMGCNVGFFMPRHAFIIIWNVVHGIVSAIYLRICSKFNSKAKIVMWCSMYASIICLSAIAGQISFLTGEFLSKGLAEGVIRCIIYLFIIPVAFYLRAFNFDEYEDMPNSGLALILLSDFSILVLSSVETIWFGIDYRIEICLLASYFCIFIIVVVAIYAMYAMCKEKADTIALQAEKQRLLSERELAIMTESNLEDLRCIRHDLKNQYAYMQILLKETRYEELQHYFQQVAENLPFQLSYIDCGNQIINTILNIELVKANKELIPVEHQLLVPPVLPFSEDDLCAIITNLMDNAIEECRRLRLEGNENTGIRIEIYPQKSYLYIMCRNTTSRKQLNHWRSGLRTTKKDELLHGFGTRIVVRLAEKYNGCAEYSLKDGQFIAKVLLDLMNEEGNL